MKKRGIGVACMYYGIGKTGKAHPASASAEILENGKIIVGIGLADMGQGANTGLAQIAAETFGVPLKDVIFMSGDSALPDAGVTSSTRSTYVMGNAVHLAVNMVMQPLLQEAADLLHAETGHLAVQDGKIFLQADPAKCVPLQHAVSRCYRKGVKLFSSVTYNPPFNHLDDETGAGIPYPTYAFATQMAEVEVDTDTGEVTVLRVIAAHDVGKAINPISVEGQIEGGIVQGIGYALFEKVEFSNGTIINPSFSTYLLPTTLDACEITPIIIEDEEPSGPFGAKGVAEPGLIPTAPAIVGAIYDAIGVFVTELPATPERILEGLSEIQ